MDKPTFVTGLPSMLFRSRKKPEFLERVRSVFWPRGGWRRMAKYVWRRLGRINASPHAIALGCAAGAFAACTPFFGFQFLLAALLAWALGGSIVASALGTFVANPLTLPFIVVGTYNLGNRILGLPSVLNGDNRLMEQLFSGSWDVYWPILKPMIVGSIPVGGAVAVLCYVPVRIMVTVYQRRRRRRLQQTLTFNRRVDSL